MPGLSESNPSYLDELGTNWQETSALTSSVRAIFSPELGAEERACGQDALSHGGLDPPAGDGCGRVIKLFFVCETIAS
jgi:hypothetical protein